MFAAILIYRSLEKLCELLESPHLEVRLATGEALALVYEYGREEDASFEDDFAVDIADTLKQLATDSHKYRAKKDRKQQRATFRDILQFIEVCCRKCTFFSIYYQRFPERHRTRRTSEIRQRSSRFGYMGETYSIPQFAKCLGAQYKRPPYRERFIARHI